MERSRFGDLKRHGFDLQSTHLRHIERLSLLTLLVVLLYLWLVALGSRILKEGTRWRVDRRDRRESSSLSDWSAQHRTVSDQRSPSPHPVASLLELKMSGN